MRKLSIAVILALLLPVLVMSADISPENAASMVAQAMGRTWKSEVTVEDLDKNGTLDFKIMLLTNPGIPDWALLMKASSAINEVTKQTSWKSDKAVIVLPVERGGGNYIALTSDCRKCSKLAKELAGKEGAMEKYVDCVKSIWKKVD